jgi:hypothetical protein
VKKACVGCGKLIPSVALDCVFCSAKQPPESALAGADLASQHQTDPTQVGMTMADLQKQAEAQAQQGHPVLGMPTSELNAVVANFNEAPAVAPPAAVDASAVVTDGAAHAESPSNGGIPAQARLTAAIPAVQLPPDAAALVESSNAAAAVAPAVEAPSTPAPVAARAAAADHASADRPFFGLGRTVMGVGGLVLISLFFLPWHGVSSWQLLETLSGADFVRQLFYLTGGIVLLSSAVLPLPFAFRACVGAAVAATPVLLGAGGVIDGWRGVVAALAVIGLPATHLLRSRAKSSAAARGLVMAAVAAVMILYLAPIPRGVPIVVVLNDLIRSGDIGLAVMGIFVLIPLVFAGLSLLGLMGRDLTDVGVLLSVLILLWAPTVVALEGLVTDDYTQLYIALALLWASATAALSLAQLLSLAARRDAMA